LQNLLQFAQNQQEISSFFLWLILNVPRATEAFPAHAQDVVKKTCYCDVHFKQRAVTEFVVAEKESVSNVYRVNAVAANTVRIWALRTAVYE
jgi:hypothetical protein